MFPLRRRSTRGFTLVELMIIVMIMGVLASIAMVAFTRQIKKSKTAEALTNLGRMYQGQATYIVDAQTHSLLSTFVDAPPTPSAMPTESRYPSNAAIWLGSPQWTSLGFRMDGAHYYQYASPGDTASFTVRALGNLDGDALYSTFERIGALAGGGELQGTPLIIDNELE